MTPTHRPSYPSPSHSDAKLVLRPVVSPEAVAVGRKFQQELLRELPGLMGQPGEALRHHAAWYSPEVCTLLSLAVHQLCLCAPYIISHRLPKSCALGQGCCLHHTQTSYWTDPGSLPCTPQLQDTPLCSCGTDATSSAMQVGFSPGVGPFCATL